MNPLEEIAKKYARQLVELRAEARVIIGGWGGNISKAPPDQREYALASVRRIFRDMDCLGLTKDGHPGHPLYIPYSRELMPFVRDRQHASAAGMSEGRVDETAENRHIEVAG
jgi:hypothetical protein